MADDTIYLLEPPGGARDALVAIFPSGVHVVDSLDALPETPRGDEGVLLVGPGVPPADVLVLVRDRAAPRSGWLVVLAAPGEEGFDLVPVALGFPVRSEDLAAHARGETPDRPILELEALLDAFSRARHDLNNPLTSALAEVQLLLLDVEEPDVREGLETVQRQLGRIRDLIQDLDRFRAPPSPEGSRP